MPVKKIVEGKVPAKIWTDNIEEEALKQISNIIENLPVYSHFAAMPDVHCGMGMPIGGVLPLINGISPNCVGVDIGCGMLAIKLNIQDISLSDLKNIFTEIRKEIPVGFNHRKERVKWYENLIIPHLPIIEKELQSSEHQIGTLGGGNHFIEFQKGSDGHIWFMIHSGSRNLGNKIAQHYHKLAVEHGQVPGDKVELAYFDKNHQSTIFNEYYSAMSFALEFAYLNRKMMADIVLSIIERILNKFNLKFREINIHHNYAEESYHGIWLHRKGATSAKEGEWGIIPGSMGSNSYIVLGKGNKESFESCAHGAGRVMSRTKAKKNITLEQHQEDLRSIGLEVSERDNSLDESPRAYKSINEVMMNQTDLVDVVIKLTPYLLPAIKG